MAGAKDFYKGIRNIRSCNYPIKEKKEKTGFDKYRIYNTTRWKNLRLKVLLKNPLCNMCGKELATEVDHIIPFSYGITDAQKLRLGFDITNLQSICCHCHNLKHNKQEKKQDEI
jgi:5-methylcytosine-specific restriction endonuclease McrA